MPKVYATCTKWAATSANRRSHAAVTSLLAEFTLYLDQEGADPMSDSVSYRQFPLWLSDAEKTALIEEFVAAIRPRMDNGPSPERRRHLLSTILFPTGAQSS